ncbi:major facilitator superfamily domain-containing protein [Dipodascopsis uninucleata]
MAADFAQDDEEDSVVLERMRSERSIEYETVGGKPLYHIPDSSLPSFGLNKDYPPLIEKERYVVEFCGPDDPDHPQNYEVQKKLRITGLLGFTTLIVAWASSIYASAAAEIAKEYHIGITVSILGVSLYVLGFASGPLMWAPFSELRGRRVPLLIGIFGFAVFNTAVATAKDIQTIMICRFFAGFSGASCVTLVPAVIGDVCSNRWRGTSMALFVAAVMCGPFFAPVLGGFIVKRLGWRWTEYVTSIFAWFCFCSALFLLEETYPPAILVSKASRLRLLTGNWAIHARQETVELNMKELFEKNFSRPIRMLVQEPILLLVTMYTSFIYGILYLMLEAFPIIFIEGYGMSTTVGELPYLGMVVGEAIGCCIFLLFEPYTIRMIEQNGGKPVPENRLLPAMIGSIDFTIGMLWLTWTGAYHDSVPWIVPTLSGIFIGSSIILLFLSLFNFILESYLTFAASAIAANTIVRSAFAAGFPLFANGMFHNLKTQWAGTLLGCIGFAMIPVPFIFYKYGSRLRKYSRFSPQPAMKS